MKRIITICLMAVMLLTMGAADVKGVLLLHFDGEDGATSTVDSSGNNHPVTFHGNAQLDTSEKYAGTASLLLDGSGDYLTIPDSPDWDILASITDSWTIDFHIKHAGQSYQFYLSQGWCWNMSYNTGLEFNGSGIALSSAEQIPNCGWHWIALCKVGNEYALYKDGQQLNYTRDNDTGIIDRPLEIGSYLEEWYYFNGYMDELRITHGNIFGAKPNPDITDFIINVPEPATMALLSLGSLVLLIRRHKKQ